MYGFNFIFCVLLACGLDSVTGNIIEFIKNFPAKLWLGMKDSWTSLKVNTVKGLTTPFNADSFVEYPANDFGEDFVKITPMVRRRLLLNKIYNKTNLVDLRRNYRQDNDLKPIIQIPYIKNPHEKYAFALKNDPEFIVISPRPKLKLINRKPLPFRRLEAESDAEEKSTSPSLGVTPSTKMIIFRNSAAKDPSYMDESDVIIKFDNFQIIINSTTKLLDKKP